MLAVKNLRVHYGKIEVLKGVSLEVRAGEIVTVIGSNGAGKTTLLRAVSGLAPIVAGEVMLEGRPIHRTPPHRISRLGVAHIPQGRQIVPDLSVEDNLRLGAYRLPPRRPPGAGGGGRRAGERPPPPPPPGSGPIGSRGTAPR